MNLFVQTVAASSTVSSPFGSNNHSPICHSFSFLHIRTYVSTSKSFSCDNNPGKALSWNKENSWRSLCCSASSTGSSEVLDPEPKFNGKVGDDLRRGGQPVKDLSIEERIIHKTIPRKPRRGRKSEAVAVEDYIRNSLEKTFATIREQSSDIPENMDDIMKDRVDDENESDGSEDDGEGVGKKGKRMMVEEESKDWPLDADVGWGVRASEYFDQHAIRNTVGEDGVEIDWEGEIDEGWVKEINCLEWEDFAFHPSPLIVLVFERYNRASDNWKALQELEKAAKVYWEAEKVLPPRTVKFDINIERDMAYALKVKEGPELLFLRGNRILYREKKIRTSDELVQMIAHFYYKAKKPSWI